MFSGLRSQRDGKVNAEALILEEAKKAKEGGPVATLLPANNITEGVAVMEQHVSNRDYVTSRNVIDSVRNWRNARGGQFGTRKTIEEFVNDPLGEKKMLKNIENLNGELKSEIYANRISRAKAKNFALEIGLDAGKRQDGRKGEFSAD